LKFLLTREHSQNFELVQLRVLLILKQWIAYGVLFNHCNKGISFEDNPSLGNLFKPLFTCNMAANGDNSPWTASFFWLKYLNVFIYNNQNLNQASKICDTTTRKLVDLTGILRGFQGGRTTFQDVSGRKNLIDSYLQVLSVCAPFYEMY
jgi:hypothetical protein